MAKIAPALIGRHTYFCGPCNDDPKVIDPVKSTGVPHCTDCGKHHPIHLDCKGQNISPPPIDYIQMFYTRVKPEEVIGIA